MNTGSVPGAKPGETGSYVNGEASTISENNVVMQDTSATGQMLLPTGANARPLGICAGDVAAGKLGLVIRSGYYWAIAQAAIAVGARLIADGTTPGRVITDPATAGTIRQVLGYAETPAAAAGDLIIVRLQIQELGIET